MDINRWRCNLKQKTMKYYIIEENKHVGSLDKGLKLETKYKPLWFDNKEDFEAKCKQLNIEFDNHEHI